MIIFNRFWIERDWIYALLYLVFIIGIGMFIALHRLNVISIKRAKLRAQIKHNLSKEILPSRYIYSNEIDFEETIGR
jgi:hypothetical protein